MIQPSSSDDTGDDVAMVEVNADERSAADSNPSGLDWTAEGGSRQRENHGRQGMSKQPLPVSASRGGCQGRRPRRAMRWLSPRKSHRTGPVRKPMRVANVDNNSLNLVLISPAGALDMANCDSSERRARDEMRHIIGSSEPDVIMGSDKDRNRGCMKKDKDHIEFLCELYEAQAAQGLYFVHELTSEASSRMKYVVKIMAMPGTRAVVADLCMFGLAACDELQSKCNGTHRRARVDAEDTIGRREQTGTWVRQAARATEEQLEKDKQELEMREQRKRAEYANRISASSMKMLRTKG